MATAPTTTIATTTTSAASQPALGAHIGTQIGDTALRILRAPNPIWLTVGTAIVIGLAYGAWVVARRLRAQMFVLERTGPAPDPATYESSADAFSASLPRSGRTASLVAVNTEGRLRSIVSFPAGSAASGSVDKLAFAVGARDTMIDPSDNQDHLDLRRRYVVKGHIVGFAGRSGARGAGISGVASTVSGRDAEGSWAGVAVRAAYAREVAKWRTDTREEFAASGVEKSGFGVHQGNAKEVAVATVYVGADTLQQAKSLGRQVVAGLPGFDSKVTFARVNPNRFTIGAGATTVAVAALTLHFQLAHFEIIPALFFVAFWLRLVPTEAARVAHALGHGRFPYPIPGRATSALMAPYLLAQFAAPQAGAASGGTVVDTERRVVPVDLYTGDHLIGFDPSAPANEPGGPNRRNLYIRDDERFEGVAYIGSAGGGKSVAMRLMFASDLLRQRNLRTSKAGTKQTIVVFESQTDTVRSYMAWCERMGVDYHVIELATGQPWAVDQFVGPTFKAQADNFVGAMKAAMGEQLISYMSGNYLGMIWTLALAVTPASAEAAGMIWTSPIAYACVLSGLGAAAVHRYPDTSDKGSDKRLADQIFEAYKGDNSQNVVDVRNAYSFLFEGHSESKRADKLGSSVNKLAALNKAAPWFGAPTRVNWATVLQSGGVVIVNTGVALKGTDLDAETSRDLATILLFQLRQAIERTCNGWEAAGSSVTIYIDELRLFALHSAEAFVWFRQSGRKYGVRLVAALQDVDELSEQVRRIVTGMATVLWFKQHNTPSSAMAIENLTLGGDVWEATEIVKMPKYHAALRASSETDRHTALVKFPYFENDTSGVPFCDQAARGRS